MDLWKKYKWIVAVVLAAVASMIVTSIISDRVAGNAMEESNRKLLEYQLNENALKYQIVTTYAEVQSMRNTLTKKEIELGSLSAANKKLAALADRPDVIKYITVDQEKYVLKIDYEKAYFALKGCQEETDLLRKSLDLCESMDKKNQEIIRDQEARFKLCSDEVADLVETRDKLYRIINRKVSIVFGPSISVFYDTAHDRFGYGFGFSLTIGKKIL